MDDGADEQRLEMLRVMQSQLEIACEAGEKPVVAGEIRDRKGASFQIRIADPCEALETVERQIEALKSEIDEVQK